MAFSFRLSLIATGSSDFTVNLFDFQVCDVNVDLWIQGRFMLLFVLLCASTLTSTTSYRRNHARTHTVQFAKRVAVLHGHTSEVTCLAFAEPYGILISGDSTGTIIFWAVRPSYYEQLAVLRNDQELLYPDEEPEEGTEDEAGTVAEKAPATKVADKSGSNSPSSANGEVGEGTFSLTEVAEPVKGPNVGTSGVHVLGVHQCKDGAYHIYTGDYRGMMRCWDVSEFLDELEIPTDARLTSCTAGYNPYRRVDQKGEDTASGVTIGTPHKPNESDEGKAANESTLHRKHSAASVRCRRIFIHPKTHM